MSGDHSGRCFNGMAVIPLQSSRPAVREGGGGVKRAEIERAGAGVSPGQESCPPSPPLQWCQEEVEVGEEEVEVVGGRGQHLSGCSPGSH